MNIDNENIEPVTDLGLALSYSNQCVQRRFMNNDSGAGANAGSGFHMTFLANSPLFELVWSPLKGPSNVALLPKSSITGRKSATHNTRLDGDDFLTLNSSFQMKGQVVAGKDASARSAGSGACAMPVRGPGHEDEAGTGSDVGEIKTVGGVSVSHINQNEEVGDGKGDSVSDRVKLQITKITETRDNRFPTFPGRINRKRADISLAKLDQPKPNDTQMEPIPGDPVDEARNADSTNRTLQMGFILTSEAHHVNKTEACSDAMANLVFQGRKCMDKMESTSENEVHKLVHGAMNEMAVVKLPPEGKDNSQLAEETPTTNKTVLSKHSPTNSRVQMNKRKGKERALSDGDLNGMIYKDEDDSHESVESCNSARSFATGKRRRNSEEDIVDGSKGFKKQMHGMQHSTSAARQDSSFMNWISNMMKGFSQSVQDDAPLPLSIAHPSDGQENPDKGLDAFNKNQEPGSKIIGFQSIFRSLYCTKEEVQETRMLSVEYQVGERSKVDTSNKTSNNNSTLLACPGENSNIGKEFLPLNERFNKSTSGNEENSAMQPKIILDELSGSWEKENTNSEDSNTKRHLEFCSKGKERMSSNTSLGKQKTKSAEQADSGLPSSGKTSKFCHRNDPLGSFWITRFSPKTPSSSLNPDHLNQSAGLSPKPSAECLKLILHTQNHGGLCVDDVAQEGRDHSAEGPLQVSGKELKKTATWIKSHDDPVSLNKLIPVLPFPVVKPSDAMASVFARRLDALKHITSPRVPGDVTCFFCGVKGHNLRDCSEIAEIELEELVKNLNAYSGVEEPACWCIRCFQHDHWAVACPKASLTKRLLIESNASFSQMQISSGNKEKGDCLRTKTDFNWKVDEVMPLRKERCSTSFFDKHVALSSEENASKENQMVPFSLFVPEQNSDVPKGLFDAVRGLRLSRGDILKWMNSHMSISHIEGFFLRLRLGKWEEGLGGTGYHVACIIGTQKDTKEQDTKHSLRVNVGGMKCLVESRYISNNDFLEDELMAWWSITSRNGDKIPSEEELRTKAKAKRMLGF